MKTRNLATFMTLTVLACVFLSAVSISAEKRVMNLDNRALDFSKAVPDQLNYQGFLVNATDSSAITATLEMTFRLFDSETNGAELWAETHTMVEVSNGLFQILLGGITAFPDGLLDGSALWLQTEVGPEVLVPRKPLVSVAYSRHAQNADHAITADLAGDAEHAIHADTAAFCPSANVWMVSGDDIYRETGKVGIGTISPLTELDVNGSVNATTYYGDGSNLTGISGLSDTDWTISGDDIYHETGNVGIGTTTPTAPLTIQTIPGTDVEFSSSGNNADMVAAVQFNIGTSSIHNLHLMTGYLTRMCVTGTGNVGIGITSPSYPLDVNGAINATTYYGDGSNLTGISGTPDNDWTVSGNNIYSTLPGNVGIGTSSPQRLLHLVGANPRILIEASSISPEVNFKNSDDVGPEVWALYKHGTTDDFRFYQNGDKVTIKNGTGYVGIGTTNPISQLHIKEPSFPTYLTVESDAGYAPGIILNVNGANEWRMLYHPSDSILTFWREGLGEQMVINNDGFVGIGTIHPSTKLHVRGQSNPWSAILYAESLQDLGYTLNGVAIHGYQSGADVGGIGVMGEASGIGVGEIGVYGYASSTTDSAIGVCGKTDSPEGYGVYYIGGLGGKGTKSTVVNTADYGWRHLYSMESTGNWFEDFGQAQLVYGKAVIAIDPIFSQTVNLSEMSYHVFLTPLGDCGLYVAEKSSTSFTVRALDGHKENIRFDYRIVAKRREYEHKRLEPAMDPDKFIQKADQLSKRS